MTAIKRIAQAMVVILLIAIGYLSYNKYTPPSIQQNNTTPREEENAEETDFPENATVTTIGTEAERIASFEITTPNDNNYYFIRLKNNEHDGEDVYIYAHPNGTIKTEVPLGQYELYYACGSKWYGHKLMFGKSTQYFKGDKTMNFYRTNEGIYGNIVKLTETLDGNLHTKPISKSDFNE